eukprot:TCONS_00018491-protein
MITSLGHPKSLTLFTKEDKESKMEETLGPLKQSSWVVTPYFMLYFTTYIINSLVWPLFVMERLCIQTYTPHKVKFDLFHMQNTTRGSCINLYMTNTLKNQTHMDFVSQVNKDTLNYMIVGSIVGAIISLLSYFLIWKPVLRKCKPLAVLLPPICILCQCVLFSYSLSIEDTKTFKYVILSGVVLPCLHSNFQGMFLLMFELTKEREADVIQVRQREITTVKIEGSYATIFLSMVVSGMMIAFCFDMAYSVLFVLQFTMGLLTTLYGAMLIPFKEISCSKDTNDEKESNENDDDEDEHLLDSSDEEEIFLMRRSQGKTETGLFSIESNIFSEAPMIFSETSYRKELMIIVEISIFTIALISDSMISGPYLLQAPFNLSVSQYGYCISAQGVAKIFGILVVQTVAYFKPCKHGGLIVLGGLNIILYYTLLGVVQDSLSLFGVMVINIFGGAVFPTISSFMKINFTKTLGTVLEIAIISSLIVTVGFHGFEYFIYSITRNIFPGTVFLLTAGLILLGFMIASVTYFTTTVRNRRKTKEITDKLLNDYQ